VVRVDPSERSRYVVRVKGTGGRFHLTVLGGRLQHATPNGSIPFPGDGAEVLAVGAVDFRGRRMSYSSCGPTLSGPKPDLVAMVPFPSVWRPDQAFAGTSAAAPQAAGIAALVWGKHPQWNAQQVREALTHAGRRTKPGHNVETGYGIVHVPK
jgi:subtilisin family serine protease